MFSSPQPAPPQNSWCPFPRGLTFMLTPLPPQLLVGAPPELSLGHLCPLLDEHGSLWAISRFQALPDLHGSFPLGLAFWCMRWSHQLSLTQLVYLPSYPASQPLSPCFLAPVPFLLRRQVDPGKASQNAIPLALPSHAGRSLHFGSHQTTSSAFVHIRAFRQFLPAGT